MGIVVQNGEYSQSSCSILTTLIDNDHTREGDDLIIWATVEPLHCLFEKIKRIISMICLIKKKSLTKSKKKEEVNTLTGTFLKY